MSLIAFAVIGSIVSLIMMAVGFVWLGSRHELEVSRMEPDQAADLAMRGWRNRPGWTWFHGKAWGMSIAGEKTTREIISLLAQGRWGEGLPWATPALGALLAFFFWPLLVGLLTGMDPVILWVLVALFTVTAIRAAWPRDE
jgi:hypothetical protein